MNSRRSFLKALCFAAGGATIASKAVSAILTPPAKNNDSTGAYEGKKWHSGIHPEYLHATYEPWYAIHPDMLRHNWLDTYPLRFEYQPDGSLEMIETYQPEIFGLIRDK